MNNYTNKIINYSLTDDKNFYISIVINTENDNTHETKPGTAHLLEHIICRKFKKCINSDCFIYGKTNNIYTFYEIIGDKKYYKHSLDTVLKLLVNLNIDEIDVSVCKDEVINELQYKNKDLYFRINEQLTPKFSVIGSYSDILKITNDDLIYFFTQKYTYKNIFISTYNENVFDNNLPEDHLIIKNDVPIEITNTEIYEMDNLHIKYTYLSCNKKNEYLSFYILRDYLNNYLEKELKTYIYKINSYNFFILSIYKNNLESCNKKIYEAILDYDSFSKFIKQYLINLDNKFKNNEFKLTFLTVLRAQGIYINPNIKFVSYFDTIKSKCKNYLNYLI